MKRNLLVRAVVIWLSVAWVHVSCGQTPQETAPADGEIPAALLAANPASHSRNITGGEATADFQFTLRNTGTGPLTIREITTSCGCTTTGEMSLPLVLAVQQTMDLPVQLNLEGKTGELTKSVFVMTDQGCRTLLVTVKIEPPPAAVPAEESARQANLRLARADRQAIFRGDCARCHAQPAEGLKGRELYAAACGICHEAEHRASMVPDLRVTAAGRDRLFWETIISQGRHDTLMPAFSKQHQGILDDAQIASLADFLSGEFPARAAPKQ